jgi:LysM repeat protein
VTTPVLLQTVSIRRLVVGDVRVIRSVRTNKLAITPEDGSSPTLLVPYSPREVSHSGIGSDYARVARAGRKDALVRLREQLHVMSFTLFVSDQTVFAIPVPGGYQISQSAMNVVHTLETYARFGTRLRLTYGLMESGIWRITSIVVNGRQRDSSSNEISQAEIELEFTQVSDVVVGIGPVTGGVQPPPVTTPPPAAQPSRTYEVKRGDTLWGISIKYYGTGIHWKRIADANGVRNPRTLQIGKKLRIP